MIPALDSQRKKGRVIENSPNGLGKEMINKDCCNCIPMILISSLSVSIHTRNLVCSVPTDVLAPDGARTSADTVMTVNLDMLPS